MQAELTIRNSAGVVGFTLEKGQHGVAGLAENRLFLVPATSTSPSPDLLIEWDPALRTLMWREAGAPRNRSQPLGSGNSFSLEDIIFSFHLKLDSPVVSGKACDSFALNSSKSYLFGRGTIDLEEGSVVRVALDAQDRSISKQHASLSMEDGEWMLSSLSSSETFLNGVSSFTRKQVVFGDRIRIGDYMFEFRGSQIDRVDQSNSGRIEAKNLAVVVKDRVTGKPFRILSEVGLQIDTGDFIGVLGGSGSGKSTLLNALCGIRPADEGVVCIGGIENSLLNKLRPGAIGYVPQDDIVHPELVVRDAFYLAARLRIRLEDKQRKALVESTIERLGLAEHASKRVLHLSGGQRKRVSIGIELLSKPSVMFLDEPSSGLDPATEESLMELLQSLTLTNLTVVCTTHVLQKAYLFERLIFVHGGRVIFEGNSGQARDFFVKHALDLSDSQSGSRSSLGINKSPLEKIYSEVLRGTKSAAEWEQEFKQWTGHQAAVSTAASPEASSAPPPVRVKRVSATSRFLTLLVRQSKILGADWLNLAFLFCQVVLIGLLIALVSDEFGFRMFLGLIATMWFGCSNGAQQIVSEMPIVKREQICGLGLNVYLGSKFAFQGFISCVQGLLLFLIIIPMGHVIHPVDFDEESFRDLYMMGIAQGSGVSGGGESEYEEDDEPFEAMELGDDGKPIDIPAAEETTETPKAKVKPKGPTLLEKLAVSPPLSLVSTTAQWFAMEDNFLDSFERPVNDANGFPIQGPDGNVMVFPAISPWRVLLVGIAFKLLAFFGAALVGVSLGLAVSAWVRTPTQAVMWVPLLLIPQILFGGYVVSLPKMSALVRTISTGFPSHSCQRIIDVSNLYGRMTPSVTNLTKHPVFLTGSAEPEEISWIEKGNKVSQNFDRESYVNTSWQNLVVIPERLGQHKRVEEIIGSDNGNEFKRDVKTVSNRGDVRYSKGTPFLFTFPAIAAMWILLAWVFICYGFALLGIHRKTNG